MIVKFFSNRDILTWKAELLVAVHKKTDSSGIFRFFAVRAYDCKEFEIDEETATRLEKFLSTYRNTNFIDRKAHYVENIDLTK